MRTKKELRDQASRIMNCGTANLDKTLNAAGRQLEAIELIEREKGLGFLPDKLLEVAVLRKENREASLQELADMCNPPMKKSGLNNRFRKIEEIARKLEEKKN